MGAISKQELLRRFRAKESLNKIEVSCLYAPLLGLTPEEVQRRDELLAVAEGRGSILAPGLPTTQWWANKWSDDGGRWD